jgi:hypothetical protein
MCKRMNRCPCGTVPRPAAVLGVPTRAEGGGATRPGISMQGRRHCISGSEMARGFTVGVRQGGPNRDARGRTHSAGRLAVHTLIVSRKQRTLPFRLLLGYDWLLRRYHDGISGCPRSDSGRVPVQDELAQHRGRRPSVAISGTLRLLGSLLNAREDWRLELQTTADDLEHRHRTGSNPKCSRHVANGQWNDPNKRYDHEVLDLVSPTADTMSHLNFFRG